MMENLATYVEQISDDFQSTFQVVNANTLANMMGFPDDFNQVTKIIQNYIPGAVVTFEKTNQLNDTYDIYLVRLIGVKELSTPHANQATNDEFA
jgi:hypothetical protein